MNYNLVVGAPIVAIIGAIVLFIVFVVPAAVLAQRVLNDTREGSTGAITNYADEENGLAAGEKAMKYNPTGNYSSSECMDSVSHNIRDPNILDPEAYCNGFMIGFNGSGEPRR